MFEECRMSVEKQDDARERVVVTLDMVTLTVFHLTDKSSGVHGKSGFHI